MFINLAACIATRSFALYWLQVDAQIAAIQAALDRRLSSMPASAQQAYSDLLGEQVGLWLPLCVAAALFVSCMLLVTNYMHAMLLSRPPCWPRQGALKRRQLSSRRHWRQRRAS